MANECVQLFQRYNLEPIHNITSGYQRDEEVCLVISKIQSGTNSQPTRIGNLSVSQCVQLFQRYNLEPIHNTTCTFRFDGSSVFSYFKDTIWNQFTTTCGVDVQANRVCLVISKIQSGTNSQRAASNSAIRASVFSYFKDTIWNQFTTNCCVE